jgi:hypothetical protein
MAAAAAAVGSVAGAVKPDEKQEKPEKQEQKEAFSAKFVRDINYPDGSEVWAGQTIVKEWEFLNPEGAAPWPKGVKLIFARGDRDLLGAQEEFPLPSAAPGEKVTVAVAIPVPEKLTGKKQAYFRLADADRNVFGDRCWVELDVKSAPAEQKELKEPVPEPVAVPVDVPAKASPVASPAPPAPVAAPVAPVSAPVPPPAPVKKEEKQAPAEDQSVPQKYKAAMTLLTSMGFENRDLNLHLLEKANGDVHRVVMMQLDLRKH